MEGRKIAPAREIPRGVYYLDPRGRLCVNAVAQKTGHEGAWEIVGIAENEQAAGELKLSAKANLLDRFSLK